MRSPIPTGRTTLSLLLVPLALVAATAASAQNLLETNPDFDGFTSDPPHPFPGWFSSGDVPIPGDDADLCPESDSYRIDDDSIIGARSHDCVPVTPGETLYLEVSYRSTALVDLRLIEAFTSTCSSLPGSTVPQPSIPASGEWTTVRRQHVVTAGKFGVIFWLRADAEGAYFVEFDRAYLGRAERIFADDFDGGSLCRWKVFDDGLPM